MHVEYAPEPEEWIVNGNPNDVFIDDGQDDDDEVGLNAPTADNDDDIFIDEGTDDDEVSSDALTANLEPPADSDDDDDADDSNTVAPTHDCRVAGCPRRPLSDPNGMRQIFGLSDRDDLCCDTCLFTDGRSHTDICNSASRSSATVATLPDDGEVFIDDGDGDDIVTPDVLAAAAANGFTIAPRTSAEWDARVAAAAATAAAAAAAAAAAPVVIPPDDDSSDGSTSDTTPRTPRTTSADAPSSNVPSVIHVCDTAGCLRRPGSDPASHGTIGYHVCCGSCAFFNGQVHTRACQEASLTPDEYHAWTLSRVPVDAALASSNGNDGRGASNLDDDHHREYGPHTYNLDSGDTSDAPTSTIMSAPTSTPPPMPTSASAPLPTSTVFNELVFTPAFPPRVDGEHCRGCNICVGRGPLPPRALTLCHCSCGRCDEGVYPGDELAQGGMCDFCCGFHVHVPQHNTYANRCDCDCNGCYLGRERLGILYDDETWVRNQSNDGEDPDSVFSTL